MGYIEPERDQFIAFIKSGIEGPIHMLNLLKFKPGGQESYEKYGEETDAHLKKAGGKVVYRAEGKAAVIGPEKWDMVLIVEYPSVEKFIEMATDDEYMKTVHFRTDALEDSRLFCMQAG